MRFPSSPRPSAQDGTEDPPPQRQPAVPGARRALGPDHRHLNGRRSITAETAVRLGRYFGNGARFWLNLQSQYDIAHIEQERGKEIAAQVRPAKWAA